VNHSVQAGSTSDDGKFVDSARACCLRSTLLTTISNVIAAGNPFFASELIFLIFSRLCFTGTADLTLKQWKILA